MDYDVEELDEISNSIRVVIDCPKCYSEVEFMIVNINDFIPIR